MSEQIEQLAEAIADGMRASEAEKHFLAIVNNMVSEMKKEDVEKAKFRALDILNSQELQMAEMTSASIH